MMKDGFEQIVSRSTPELQALARRVREMVRRIMPDVTELTWEKQDIVSFGVGPKKMSEHFCYIALFNSHINLGFYYGADLPDPAGLLEGSGKSMRHIKVAEMKQLENPLVNDLLLAASGHFPKLKSANRRHYDA